jgi:uracil-DNA glycosylase
LGATSASRASEASLLSRRSPNAIATVHSSALLRAETERSKQEFVRDLEQVAALIKAG